MHYRHYKDYFTVTSTGTVDTANFKSTVRIWYSTISLIHTTATLSLLLFSNVLGVMVPLTNVKELAMKMAKV